MKPTATKFDYTDDTVNAMLEDDDLAYQCMVEPISEARFGPDGSPRKSRRPHYPDHEFVELRQLCQSSTDENDERLGRLFRQMVRSYAEILIEKERGE